MPIRLKNTLKKTVMNNHNIFLVSYDISDNRKRNKIAKLLEQYGYERIQYSVFTGLLPVWKIKELWARLEIIAESYHNPENRIICFAISKNSLKNMKIIGNFTADMNYLTGEKHTEIF